MKSLNVFKISKFATSTALASILMITGYSAQAMLPTPQQELANPTLEMPNNNDERKVQAATVQYKTVAALVSTDAQGKPALLPIDSKTRLKKGNIIEYHTYITNTGNDRMRSMTITMSIPEQVKLVSDISPKNAFASVDGNAFGRMPLRTRMNGQVQDLPFEHYKHLRWKIEGLGLDETAVVKYRAVVR